MRELFLLTAFLFIGLTSFSQQFVSKDSITEKLRRIRTEINSLTNTTSEIRERASDCRMIINDALLRLDQATINYPISYSKSMNRLVELSRQLKRNDTVIQKALLIAIARDLQIKFKPRLNKMAESLFSEELSVKITSLKNGAIINNLRVRYAALGYKVDYSRPDKSFQALTSPASENMVPGYYEIWLTEDGSFKVLQSWIGEISPDQSNNIPLNIK